MKVYALFLLTTVFYISIARYLKTVASYLIRPPHCVIPSPLPRLTPHRSYPKIERLAGNIKHIRLYTQLQKMQPLVEQGLSNMTISQDLTLKMATVIKYRYQYFDE
jgi:hypothetical protein